MAADNGHPAGANQPDVLSTRSTVEVPPMPATILIPRSGRRKNALPSFQFYPADFLADGDQTAMSLEEVGAYIRLLAHSWLKGGLPNDVPKLARMIAGNVQVVEVVLREHFVLKTCGTTELWFNPRLERERARVAKYQKQASVAGTRSAEKRAQRALNGSATGVERALNGQATPQPQPHASVQTPPVSVATPLPTKPLGYKPRIDVAWPGRPPVPGALHAEFVSKLGGSEQEASRRLRAWYPTAAAPYDNQPIGDDDWKFWRARFREWQGTTVKPIQPAEPRETDEQILAKIREWDAQKARR